MTIDAKAYAGRLEVRGRGRELWIAGRNRSKLIDQAQRQRAVVVETLHRAGLDDVPVESVLCFVGTQFPRFFRPERIGEVQLTTLSRLSGLLTDGEPRTADEQRDQIVEALQRALRPACGDRDQLRRAIGHATASTEHNQEAKSKSAPAETERICGRCGAAMLVRRRRSDGAHFLGCSAFPRCRNASDVRAG